MAARVRSHLALGVTPAASTLARPVLEAPQVLEASQARDRAPDSVLGWLRGLSASHSPLSAAGGGRGWGGGFIWRESK